MENFYAALTNIEGIAHFVDDEVFSTNFHASYNRLNVGSFPSVPSCGTEYENISRVRLIRYHSAKLPGIKPLHPDHFKCNKDLSLFLLFCSSFSLFFSRFDT